MFRDDRLAKEAVYPFLNKDNLTPAEQGFFTMSLYGTPFQLSVWRALLGVEYGKTVSYSKLAGAAGYPAAVRAAASAVGSNPISLLIPCHRIIRNDGTIGKYMWGTDIKAAILRWEKETTSNRSE